MRRIRELVLVVSLAGTASLARAELSPPNAAGVAMGHLHYVVRDVAANKAFWVALGRPLHPVQRHDRRHRVPRRRRAAAPRRAGRRHRRIRRQPRRVPREVRRSDRQRGLRRRVQRAVSGRCIGAHAGGRTHRAIRRRARDESRLHDRRRPQRCGGGASQPQDRSADHCAPRSSQRAGGSSRGGEGVVRDSLRRRGAANAGATKPSICPASTSTSPASTWPRRRLAAACSITSASR